MILDLIYFHIFFLEDNFTWTQDAVRLLLTEYEKRKEKFRNPTIKKKMLWSEIKNIFDEHSYKISSDGLDKKFRNLKKNLFKNSR